MYILLHSTHRLDDIFSTASYTILPARPHKRGLPMHQYSDMARRPLSSQCSDMRGSNEQTEAYDQRVGTPSSHSLVTAWKKLRAYKPMTKSSHNV